LGNIRGELLKEDNDEIFYSDKLKKVFKKYKQQKQTNKKTEEVEVRK
jgi:hypothetical protein